MATILLTFYFSGMLFCYLLSKVLRGVADFNWYFLVRMRGRMRYCNWRAFRAHIPPACASASSRGRSAHVENYRTCAKNAQVGLSYMFQYVFDIYTKLRYST